MSRIEDLEKKFRVQGYRERNEPGWIITDEWRELTLKEASQIKAMCYGSDVLDLCCGTGWLSNMLSKVANSVSGIDKCAEAIEYAKLKYKAPNYFIMDATELTFRNNVFDLVVFREAIEHFTCKDSMAALEQISRVLKPNGILYGTTGSRVTPLNEIEKNPFHERLFTRSELMGLLNTYFNRVEINYEHASSPRMEFKSWKKK